MGHADEGAAGRTARGCPGPASAAFERSGPDALASVRPRLGWKGSRARCYSELTVRQHEADLHIFIAWAAERDVTRAGEVTRPMLEAYQRWLSRCEAMNGRNKGKRLAWGTQRHRLHVLRSWFRRLTRQNLILHNPASELELPRRERRLPVHGADDGGALPAARRAEHRRPAGRARPRHAGTVLLHRHPPRGVGPLELTDVSPERGTLAVRQGKGKKDRVVPLGATAAAWIERYLREARPRLCLDAREPALFLTGYGEAFSADVLSRTWSRTGCARRASSGRGSCHLLRHTCATLMLEGGADIRFIQQLLGHANLDTTAIYTQVTHPAADRGACPLPPIGAVAKREKTAESGHEHNGSHC